MNEGWRRVPLGQVATIDIDKVPVESGRRYSIAGVLNAGRGLFGRDAIDGSQTNYPTLHRLRSGQLVMRKLTAWEGPITCVSPEYDGFFVSAEFPTFTLGPDLLPSFMSLVCKRPEFWESMKDRSTGSVQRRKRVSSRELLAIPIDLPPIAEQCRIVDFLSAAEAAIEGSRTATERANEAFRSMRDSRVAGLWSSAVRPLGAVLDRMRRPLAISPDERYAQIGIRSHGNGIFHKPEAAGASLGNKAVFGIEPGDLVFNIVFAWEGAVAVASPSEAGRCGSHRFPTYRARPNVDVAYVQHVLLSPLGLRLLGLASPGSAGRNRTLNQTSLMRSAIPVPGLDEQERLVRDLESIAAVTTAHVRNLRALERLRDALLADLLSGEHQIPTSYDRFLDPAA